MKVDVKALVMIDHLLRDLSGAEQDNQIAAIAETLCNAIMDAIGVPISLSNSRNLRFVMESRFDPDKKRFVAICLIRMLRANKNIFKVKNISINALMLIEDVFGKSLYKALRIQTDWQNYAKENTLRSALSTIESELEEMIVSVNNLDMLPSFYNDFRRKLNLPISKEIILPFLPGEISINARLGDVFKSLEEYSKAPTENVLRLYNNSQDSISSLKYISERWPTWYSRKYILKLCECLSKLLSVHFQASPLSKPADLRILVSDKKYPFHIPNNEIGLIFRIENFGLGYATHIEINAEASAIIDKPVIYLDHLTPNSSMNIIIPCHTSQPDNEVLVFLYVEWSNYDGSRGRYPSTNTMESILHCQRTDIPWEKLERAVPYSLEAVSEEKDLVGRKDTLNKLQSLISTIGIGNAYLYGQKRVGKTSIAKTLKAKLEKSHSSCHVIYLEGGKYIHPDPKQTIQNLIARLVKEIKFLNPRYITLTDPHFDGSLSPLAEYLDDLVRNDPNVNILFILDEFDQLPSELFRTGPIGNSFFLTLRSISGEHNFGIILIGGEKMRFIIGFQGGQLNKFEHFPIDYFDKDRNFNDFQDLVKNPLREWFDIKDEVVAKIFNETSGNPFFAKLICKELFSLMVSRRDNDITLRELDDALSNALHNTGSNAFQHFWDDGILDGESAEERKLIFRRKLLLSFAEICRQNKGLSISALKSNCVCNWAFSENAFDSELREFQQRNVLFIKDEFVECKIPFFQKWLIEYGYKQIMTKYSDYDVLVQKKLDDEEMRITAVEIISLIRNWSQYKGREIAADHVRAWLEQFGDVRNQRIMFKILNSIRFFNHNSIRSKAREAHEIVRRGLIRRVVGRQQKREDIIISALDQLGKSGNALARIYADENDIYAKNVIDRCEIASTLAKRIDKSSSMALVFIDDFLGTGNSALEYLSDIENKYGDYLKKYCGMPGDNEKNKRLHIYFVAICGFLDSKEKIESSSKIPIKVNICYPLSIADRVFSDKSKVFSNNSEREQALLLAREYGSRLEPKWPLGYGDCQTCIVFEDSCPNNNLPILWKETTDFMPLFKR